jgi:hypothetical protein
MSTNPPELQGKQRKGRGKRTTNEKEVASSEEKIMPGAVAEAGAFTGPRNRIPRHKAAKQQTNTPAPGDAPSSALASAQEMSHLPELQGKQRKGKKGRKGRGNRTTDEAEVASSKEKIMPGAVAEAGAFTSDEEMGPGEVVAVARVFTGPTSPSDIDEPSLIIAELAEPSKREEELERRLQELENVHNRAVTGTVIVDNSKDRRFFIGAALALLLVVGVILGVTIPLTTKNDNDNDNKGSPSIGSTVTPTQSPSPTKAPTAAPTVSTSLDCLPASHDVCQNFAVHAGDSVIFGGAVSTIHGGNMGVSPGTSIIGLYTFEIGGVVDESSVFAASVVVAHAAAMGFRDDEIALGTEIGGKSFTPGTYRSSSFTNGAVVTLDGEGDDTSEFLFIAGTTLVTAADTHFILVNGAKAENVVWALGTAATLGARSVVQGSILAGTAITFGMESELHGCALAQSAVTFAGGGYIDLTD